ncbi:unnamed protein product [Rhizoctonia solani]|uniref:FAD-binding PCMH-type domain-containing protein n=1 Tax=Rhizoctonia solani TaxID=456999 RepID=A0A8H3CQG3_9AGAM|nr:unnamed protein product [Rhizoctonia solani]
MILDILSRTPGLVTPFDVEFHEIPEHLVIREVDVPHESYTRVEAREYERNATDDIRAVDSLRFDEANYALVLPRSVAIPPSLAFKRHEPISRSAPREPGFLTVVSGPVHDLRTLIPSSKILTLEDGDEYMPSALTRNLLYARKAPGIVVVTDRVQDIQFTVNFARERNIPLTVQNGGHSYASYSLNHEGILINMKQFKNVEVNLTSTPKKATIQAGCQWINVYDHFKSNGYKQVVLGGRCQEVGVSGYTLGGGVSPFSRRFGLGIDSILEMKVVTASGDLVTVTPEDTDPKKKDLFWALRGGGGGNFGILTEFTTQIHDLVDKGGEVIYSILTWEFPGRQSEFEAMIEVLNSTTWPDELTMDVIWQEKGKKPTGGLIVVYDGTMQDYQKAIEPLTRFICDSQVKKCHWWDVAVKEQGWYAESPAFHHHTSFVFAERTLTPEVVKAINELMKETRDRLDTYDPKGKAYIIWVHLGGKTTKVNAEDTAFFWRDAAYVSYFKLQWYKREAMSEMIKLVEEVKENLLPYTIEKKAAYVNFVDRTIPNWQEAYYGDNYPRLQEIKKDWDPDNFFKFEQSVELPGATATGPRSGTGEDLRNAMRQTEIIWDQYALRHPEKIWSLPGPILKEKDVLRIIREELES